MVKSIHMHPEQKREEGFIRSSAAIKGYGDPGRRGELKLLPDAAVTNVISAILGKKEWWKKIDDIRIVEKWMQELLDLGFSKAVVERSISEIKGFYRSRWDGGAYPASVDGAWADDSGMDSDLFDQLRDAIDALSRSEDVDWHPGTNDRVRDLVHPSLYCLVSNETKRVFEPMSTASCIDVAGEELVVFDSTSDDKRLYQSDQYQWLPSEFHVSKNGKVSIESYINNLHPEKYLGLYGLIEKIFEEKFVSLFEHVLGDLKIHIPDRLNLDNLPHDLSELYVSEHSQQSEDECACDSLDLSSQQGAEELDDSEKAALGTWCFSETPEFTNPKTGERWSYQKDGVLPDWVGAIYKKKGLELFVVMPDTEFLKRKYEVDESSILLRIEDIKEKNPDVEYIYSWRPSTPSGPDHSCERVEWDGKGVRPKWVDDYEKSGGSLDDLKRPTPKSFPIILGIGAKVRSDADDIFQKNIPEFVAPSGLNPDDYEVLAAQEGFVDLLHLYAGSSDQSSDSSEYGESESYEDEFYDDDYEDYEEYRGVPDGYVLNLDALLMQADMEPRVKRETPIYSLKNRTLQVITKIASMQIPVDEEGYEGGQWHVEGMNNEAIVATGICYLDVENIAESRLGFRRSVSREFGYDFGDQDSFSGLGGHEAFYELFGRGAEDETVQDEGYIVAQKGRCLAFPNTFQHRVDAFKKVKPKKSAIRTILCFFLVDPENTVISTAFVPPQQISWATDAHTDKSALMDSKRAKEHRLKLMEERSAKNEDEVDGDTSFASSFSLCEH